MDAGNYSLKSLEPYLLMSKSAKGAAATKLIADATSATGTFMFAELLDMPNIQEVSIMSAKFGNSNKLICGLDISWLETSNTHHGSNS